MYARAVTLMAKPEAMDEILEIAKTSVLEAMRQENGFVEWILLIDRESGKALSIPIWETEEAMVAGEESGYLQAQFNKVGFGLTAPPAVEHYEVGVHGKAQT